MNQPYPDIVLTVIFDAFLFSIGGLLVLGLAALCRTATRAVCNRNPRRNAERTAARIAARTDFDAALAHLAKDTDQ